MLSTHVSLVEWQLYFAGSAFETSTYTNEGGRVECCIPSPLHKGATHINKTQLLLFGGGGQKKIYHDGLSSIIVHKYN